MSNDRLHPQSTREVSLSTYCASPDTTPDEKLRTLAHAAQSDPITRVLLDAVSGYLIIVDSSRQIVASNDDLLNMLGMEKMETLIGKRTGDMLSCAHATEGPNGCGTSRSCRKCGALLTLLSCQKSNSVTEGECVIESEGDNGPIERTFSVRCTPLELQGEILTAILFIDVTKSRQRETLQELFFHDVNNILAGLLGHSELLSAKHQEHSAQDVANLTVQLSQEIRSYATLLGAERGDVTAHPVLVIAEDVLNRVSHVFTQHGVSAGKSLEVACRSSRSRLHVDSVILARVLINMVKNALEASPAGGTVRLIFERQGGVPVFKVWNSGAIPEHVKPRIFERSFSTKTGSRRGFGTYSMKLFGEQVLNGKVSFVSSDTEGTIFQIELP
jgi:hypothetical protein